MTDPRVLYGGPELAPLWQALWQRYSSGQTVASVTLRGLDPPQRSALADLLGLHRTPPGETTVPVATLDAVPRCGTGWSGTRSSAPSQRSGRGWPGCDGPACSTDPSQDP